jgi:hypothetical protein
MNCSELYKTFLKVGGKFIINDRLTFNIDRDEKTNIINDSSTCFFNGKEYLKILGIN